MLDEQYVAEFRAAIHQNPEEALYRYLYLEHGGHGETPDVWIVDEALEALGEDGDKLCAHFGGYNSLLERLEEYAEEYWDLVFVPAPY